MAQAYYSPLTIDPGTVPSTLTDFPCLLKYTDNRLRHTSSGGHVASTSGFDLRVYSDSALSSPLDYELVHYVASTGEIEMWVRIPSFSDSSVFYLGYGDTTLTIDGSSPTTWRSEYKAVFHVPNGTTLSLANSSQSSISPTNNGVTAVAGKIDGGANAVSASSQNVNLGTVADLNITGDITLSAWVKTTSGAAQVLIGGYSAGSIGYSLSSGFNLGGRMDVFTDGGGIDTSTSTISDGNWHLVHAVISGSTYTHYTNGSATGTGASGPPSSFSGDRKLFSAAADNTYWNGDADEIRIYSGALSADWIAAEYNIQNDPAGTVLLGTEVEIGGGVILMGDGEDAF